MKVSTGLYVDGVPVLNAIGFENEMLDIERVEVLKGPQGTIYGKGAEAGAISIITRQPGNTFQGKVSCQGGQMLSAETGGKWTGSAAFRLSGPIIQDTLFWGVSGKYAQKDGFIHNTLTNDTANDKEHWFGNAHLRWTPVTKLDISFTASALRYDNGGNNYSLAPPGAAVFQLPAPENRRVSSNMDEKMDSSNQSQSLKIAYDITDSLALTSITTNWDYEYKIKADYDYSPGTIYHIDRSDDYKKVSQELRLNFSDERFKWLLGLYYEKEENDVYYNAISMFSSVNDRSIDGDTYAVYANITHPLTRNLSLNAGLRYETEEQAFEIKTSGERRDNSWHALTPKAALDYRCTPETMIYASVAKGYRSGGFSSLEFDPDYYGYGQESLWSYEIGIKNRLLDNRLVLNASIYYMDISDMQVEEATSPDTFHTTNAAKAVSKGFEVEMTARVAPGVTIDGSFGYNNTEFDTFSDAWGDYKGNKTPWAPGYTFHIGGQYRHTSGFYARTDLIGYGEMFFDKANRFSRASYGIVNAKIGYETKQFDVYLYGKNIFDKAYDCTGAYNGFYTIYSEPGEAGLQLNFRF